MVLRKCTVCDRRFTKTEHFKRHERSHTKERPYECRICHKRYARSDVLSRHVKGHNSTPDDGASIPRGRPPASQQTPIQNTPTILDAPPAVTAQDDTQGLLPGMGVQMHPVQDLSSASHAMAPPPPPDIPPPSVAYMADIYTHFDRSEADTNSMLADGQQTYSGWNRQSTPGPSSDRGPALGSIPNEMLQLWLESWGDTYSPNDSLELARSPNFGVGAGDLVPSLDQQHRPSIDSSKSDNIPNERFAKVQRYWLAPSNSGGRLINSLWGDIASSDLDNIFAVRAPNLLGSRANLLRGSRYGLDEECKQLLQAAFCPVQAVNHQRHPQSAAGLANSLPNFPPAEILDMALDIYFRDFHPLVPFVHIPTFSAKNTRPLLLYVMCLIGMAMLGTKGAMNFVLRNFEPVLEMVTAGLSKCSLGCENPSSTLSTFATALLFLNLSSMTGEKEHFEKCQMLYVNLISIAQRHGLFTPAEGQLLDASLFEASDIDKRWKVWSMIESTKRLVTGLLLLDSSYSSFLSTSPIIASDSVQLILPCSEDLFRARSSTQWMQLLQSGKRILMPTIMPPSENVKIPVLESPADDLCVPGVLAMIQIRLSEAYHRLLSNRASYPFAPCHTYAVDGRARCLPSLQLQIANEYGEALTRLNPNAPIMWHNMCMKLTADIQIFDLAAGRAGPVPARKALDDIAAWSQTPAARRACLHAAHIYKSMATRKTSDHPICHSVFSLFSAALVLGLYIFMVPNSPETQTTILPGIELLDDVDWKQLGTEGFTSFMEPQGIQSLGPTDNPATNFVRNGGTVYFRGLPFQGGYLAVRRILLDYAGLLKDAGPWSVRKFSYILHIMSDVLMDME